MKRWADLLLQEDRALSRWGWGGAVAGWGWDQRCALMLRMAVVIVVGCGSRRAEARQRAAGQGPSPSPRPSAHFVSPPRPSAPPLASSSSTPPPGPVLKTSVLCVCVVRAGCELCHQQYDILAQHITTAAHRQVSTHANRGSLSPAASLCPPRPRSAHHALTPPPTPLPPHPRRPQRPRPRLSTAEPRSPLTP